MYPGFSRVDKFLKSIALFVATFILIDLAKKSGFKQIYLGFSRIDKYLNPIALFVAIFLFSSVY